MYIRTNIWLYGSKSVFYSSIFINIRELWLAFAFYKSCNNTKIILNTCRVYTLIIVNLFTGGREIKFIMLNVFQNVFI